MDETRTCTRCGERRPASDFTQTSDLCTPCRRRAFRNAAGMYFGGLLEDEPIEVVAGGWRMATTFDGSVQSFLCDHFHPSPISARRCLRDAGCTHEVHWSEGQALACRSAASSGRRHAG